MMNITRYLIAATLFTSVSFVSGRAEAQFAAKTLGTPGQVSLSAERLFGLNVINIEQEPDGTNGQKIEYSGTEFSFLLGSRDRGGYLLPAVSSVPRIGVDYFVVENISIGFAGGIATFGGSIEQGNAENEYNTFVFFVGPRAGYYFMFGDTVGVWVRAGVNIVSGQTEIETTGGTTDLSVNLIQLGAEGMLTFMPTEGFFLGIGPTFEFLGSGNEEQERGNQTAEFDTSGNNFGIYASIGGVFDF